MCPRLDLDSQKSFPGNTNEHPSVPVPSSRRFLSRPGDLVSGPLLGTGLRRMDDSVSAVKGGGHPDKGEGQSRFQSWKYAGSAGHAEEGSQI